jgi:hypothetical protein
MPRFLVAAGSALTLLVVAPPALATDSGQSQSSAQQETEDGVRVEVNGRNRRNRNAQVVEQTPQQIIQAAQVIANAANVPCQVTQAKVLGQTDNNAMGYEAVCASGPGYILVGSTPPEAGDCVLLAGQADIDRARDPAADVGTQCTFPENVDVVRVIRAYAVEAGVTCTVDQGASIGRSRDDNLIYEVGCDGVDGAWIERLPTGWRLSECSQVIIQNGTCRFSTAAEQAATLAGRMASNPEAAACDVSQARYMGANANGSFFEAKCAAGNGVIVRFNPTFEVQQVYPCETAQRVGGGCTLTVVAAAPEATAPQQ